MTDLEGAYKEIGPRIVGYLTSTGTDEASAFDLLHDAFERIVSRGVRPGDDIRSLAFTTARNLRANKVRDESRVSLMERPEDVDTRTTDGLAATEETDRLYLRRRIARALASLAPVLRETYTLYHIGGLGVKEVAAATGATENLVKVRLYRAKCALRRELSDPPGSYSSKTSGH